jgi:hypothetical protein
MFKLALDAGHGLNTKGKQTPDGIKEWALNDIICDEIQKILKNYNCEILRLDNNEGKVDESLIKRLNRALDWGAKVIVSIHHNAYKGVWGNHSGVEVYIDNRPTEEDKKLANLIYGNLVNKTGLKGRGIKNANFTIINTNKTIAVLCEGGFMDSKTDYKIITSPSGQRAYAESVAEAIIEMFNLKKKSKKTEKEEDVSVEYQVYTNEGKRWLPKVNGLEDYAGIYGKTIGAVYAKLTKGNIYYRVHLKGNKWLPEVKNREDYAGICGLKIDGLAMRTDTGKKIKYAVHLKSKNRWLPFVTGYNVNDKENGYAGILGQEIDGIRIYID